MAGKGLSLKDTMPHGWVRRIVMAYLAVILTSCVPTGHNYRVIPGLQGPDISMEIDPIAPGSRASRAGLKTGRRRVMPT